MRVPPSKAPMPADVDQDDDGPMLPRPRRVLGALLIGLGRKLGGDHLHRRRRHDGSEPREETPGGPVDIVDQAEAFQTLRVSDVMTPRVDIVALEVSTPFDEVTRQFAQAEHSRMPIYRETLDEPIGVVNIRDVFKLLQSSGEQQRAGWKEQVLRRLRREILYVPASMRAADLLIRMQANRIHMALVIDEFGGTDGLVTMEDLIEAVVGEIDDEYDETAALITERPGGVYEAEGRAPLEALEQVLGAELSPPEFEEEIDTVAGLVSAIAGRLPQRGEVITHPAGYEFEVTEADPRRVKRVRVRPTQPPPIDGAAPSPRAAGA